MHRSSSKPFPWRGSFPHTGPGLRVGTSSPVSQSRPWRYRRRWRTQRSPACRRVHGLYALLLPALAYALFGSSRQLIIGPEGSIAALVAAAVLPLAAAGSNDAAQTAALLALLVGACFLVARLVRLGWVADYFSRPVLIGYIHGVVVVLIVGQLGKMLGVPVDARNPLGQLLEVARELGDVSGATILVGVVALGRSSRCAASSRSCLPR